MWHFREARALGWLNGALLALAGAILLSADAISQTVSGHFDDKIDEAVGRLTEQLLSSSGCREKDTSYFSIPPLISGPRRARMKVVVAGFFETARHPISQEQRHLVLSAATAAMGRRAADARNSSNIRLRVSQHGDADQIYLALSDQGDVEAARKFWERSKSPEAKESNADVLLFAQVEHAFGGGAFRLSFVAIGVTEERRDCRVHVQIGKLELPGASRWTPEAIMREAAQRLVERTNGDVDAVVDIELSVRDDGLLDTACATILEQTLFNALANSGKRTSADGKQRRIMPSLKRDQLVGSSPGEDVYLARIKLLPRNTDYRLTVTIVRPQDTPISVFREVKEGDLGCERTHSKQHPDRLRLAAHKQRYVAGKDDIAFDIWSDRTSYPYCLLQYPADRDFPRQKGHAYVLYPPAAPLEMPASAGKPHRLAAADFGIDELNEDKPARLWMRCFMLDEAAPPQLHQQWLSEHVLARAEAARGKFSDDEKQAEEALKVPPDQVGRLVAEMMELGAREARAEVWVHAPRSAIRKKWAGQGGAR